MHQAPISFLIGEAYLLDNIVLSVSNSHYFILMQMKQFDIIQLNIYRLLK